MMQMTTTKPSESDKVDAYLKRLKHPLKDVVVSLRKIILEADPEIGEEIKWNAPTYFYTGEMEQSDPKLHKRYLIVFNLFKKDCIRLVFWGGGKVNDKSGFLQGNYADGRRLALFRSVDDVKSNKKHLLHALKQQLKHLDN
jgi:hypothetical protein